ncbi:hypothetical protein V8F33_003781 [Rhypophila sp. PSN 637]
MFTSLMWFLFGLAISIISFAYIALIFYTLLVTLHLVVPMISPVILDEEKIEALGIVLMELALMALLYELYVKEAAFRDDLHARLWDGLAAIRGRVGKGLVAPVTTIAEQRLGWQQR